MKYEYQVIKVVFGRLQDGLNIYGSKGWRAIHMEFRQFASDKSITMVDVVLEREIKE